MAKKKKDSKINILPKEPLEVDDAASCAVEDNSFVDVEFKELSIDGEAIDQEKVHEEKLEHDLAILNSKDLTLYRPKNIKDPLYQYLDEISKYDLLCLANKAFQLNVDIIPDDTQNHYPTLDATKLRNKIKLKVPTWEHMMIELANNKIIKQ